MTAQLLSIMLKVGVNWNFYIRFFDIRAKIKSIKPSIPSGNENEKWRCYAIKKKVKINRCGKIDKIQLFGVFFSIDPLVCRAETTIDSTPPHPSKNNNTKIYDT